MSYAVVDDRDRGISTFRTRLEQELQAQSGEKISIFQSAEDITVGESWRERLAEGLGESTFLLPILTPSFLNSSYCRDEVATFLDRERSLGRTDLVLPVYYIDCSGLSASSSSEAVSETLQALLDHQYSDWRPLRLRPASHQQVRLKRAELASEIRAAMDRAPSRVEAPPSADVSSQDTRPDGVALSPASSRIEAPSDAPSQEARSDESLHDLLSALVRHDPVTSWPAARELSQLESDHFVPAVVNVLANMNHTSIHVVRWLLAQYPKAAGPPMVRRLKLADRDWHSANFVPNCLSPPISSYCAGELRECLAPPVGQINVARKALEGLGYLGSRESSFAIYEFLKKAADRHDSDLYQKYNYYCVLALARIVVLMPFPDGFFDQLDEPFGYLESAVALAGARGWEGTTYGTLLSTLAEAASHHSDRLLSKWLISDNEDLRHLGAYSLGGIGLRRATAPLLALAGDTEETQRVRSAAAFAVGVIGGTAAVEGLAALRGQHEPEGLSRALVMCVGDAKTSESFTEVAAELLESDSDEKCFVYQAIGRRKAADLADRLRDGLSDPETTIRGDSALALARINGRDDRGALIRAREEASTVRERVLTTLALLLINEQPSDDPDLSQLRSLLATESYAYRSKTRADITESLRTSSHPEAAAIADAWQPIYKARSAY